ncbi:MAG: acyltransferase [Prevotella sp.]|nr:acyltransferase [Prevotella sp.]
MTNDELMSKTISSLRFPLTVMVVMGHFNFVNNDRGFGIHGVMYGQHMPDFLKFLINYPGMTLVTMGVPLFFMIAGYLFFFGKTFNFEVYKKKLKNRFHSLFVPYVMWNTIAILLIAIRFLPVFSSLVPGMDQVKVNLTLSGFLHTYYDNFHNEGLFIYPYETLKTTTMPIDAPLWFVRDLMYAVLISPVLYWLIKKLKFWAIVLWAIVAYVISPLVAPNGTSYGMFLDAPFFFSWGAYYSINKQNLIVEMRKLKWVPYIYLPMSFLDTYLYNNNMFVHYASVPFGAITAIIFMSYLLEKGVVKENKLLSESSFFVFCMHMTIMWEMGKFIFVMLHLKDEPITLFLFFFGIVTLTILVCLGTYVILNKYAPKVCRLLTGGR